MFGAVGRRWMLIPIVAAIASTAACGSSGSAAPDSDAFEVLSARGDTASYAVERTLPELLADPGSGLIVVEGTVTAVDEGVGMTWTFDDDTELRHLTAFDDDEALVRSVHLTMAVDRLLAGTADDAAEVRFGLAIHRVDDHATLAAGLTGGRYVVFLIESPVYDYEPGLYGVMIDGGLLCRLDAETLDCPALEAGLARALDLAGATEMVLPTGG